MSDRQEEERRLARELQDEADAKAEAERRARKTNSESPDDGNGLDREESKQKRQADVLIAIAEEARLSHFEDSGYATIMVNGHEETWPIRTKGFKRWLIERYYIATDRVPGSETLQAAINVIDARAYYEGDEVPVFLRVGGAGDKIYIDLCDSDWRSVEISPDGWNVVDGSPVRFRRSRGMRALAEPERGSSVADLRAFLNLRSKEQFVLLVAWILAAMRNCGPYPVLAVGGEQGSAKSTLTRILRELIDPNVSPLRSLPREERDLFVAANGGHLIALDNVSGIPAWLSDAICRLSTGGGFSVRQLYTDQDEILFEALKPVILNGIEDAIGRPDLADRTIFLTLQTIKKRQAERQVLNAFAKAQPKIMGALLDTMVHGLKYLPDTDLEELPRMADFALWVTACESALWKKGTFISAYGFNISEATLSVLEGDIVAAAISEFMAGKDRWVGSTKQLLENLDQQVGDAGQRRKEWPKTVQGFTGRLTRLAPAFRKSGLNITRGEREAKIRPIHLEWVGKNTSSASPTSEPLENKAFLHDEVHDDLVTGHEHDEVCVGHDEVFGEHVTDNSLKSKGNDAHDANDEVLPLQSSSDDGDQFAGLKNPKLASRGAADESWPVENSSRRRVGLGAPILQHALQGDWLLLLVQGDVHAPGWTNIKTHEFRCDKCWKPADWIPPLFEKRPRRRRSSASGSD